MAIINATPHAIVISAHGDNRHMVGEGSITIEPCGQVARVSVSQIESWDPIREGGLVIPVVENRYGEVEGLPEYDPQEDIVLVSVLVGSRLQGVAGIYMPDTGPTAIRNEKGHIVAVTRLVKA